MKQHQLLKLHNEKILILKKIVYYRGGNGVFLALFFYIMEWKHLK